VAVTGTLSLRRQAARVGALAVEGVSWEAVVLAAAFPILFIHARYQPTIHVGLRSTTVGIQLADFAVLAVVIAALVAGVQRGWATLRPGVALWTATGLWFVWIGIEILIPHGTAGYPAAKHTVTGAKFLEYALLAPSFVLIVRRRSDLRLLLVVVTAWSVLASAVGLIQFFGANIFVSGATGGRQLSFLGFHDFASLSSAALLLGVVALAFPRLAIQRRLGWTAIAAGAVGVILSAAIAAVVGIVAACIGLLAVLVSRHDLIVRRLIPVGLVVAVALLGAIGMRSTDLGRYLGLSHETKAQRAGVESYAHRSLLVWIGWRIFRDHPVAGVGWEASGDPSRFESYIPAAKRRFPTDPPISFPSPQHPWGVQNFYVQTLADLGVIGLLLVVAMFAAALWLAVSGLRVRSSYATLGLAWLVVVAGLWIAMGIVAGIPLDALTWLTLGLAAASPFAVSARG
jgi:O-antigen ligase